MSIYRAMFHRAVIASFLSHCGAWSCVGWEQTVELMGICQPASSEWNKSAKMAQKRRESCVEGGEWTLLWSLSKMFLLHYRTKRLVCWAKHNTWIYPDGGGLCFSLTIFVPVSPEGILGATTGLKEGLATGGVQQLLWLCIPKHT